MYTLSSKHMTYSLNEQGLVTSIVNGYSGHEYCIIPGETFKLIYKEDDCEERPIFGSLQTPSIRIDGNVMTVMYDKLVSDNRTLDISLTIRYELSGDTLTTGYTIKNNSDVLVAEFQFSPVSGIQSLNGNPKEDYVMWPANLGAKIANPAFTDLSTMSGFRKYERHDFLHTDLDKLYPGHATMQFYVLCNDSEGIYVGSHDKTHQTTGIHVERRVKDNTLRLGIIKYPFAEPGEEYISEPIVYAMLDGDWHLGSKIYRKWIEEECGWRAPTRPEWAQEFQGWLRCIFRTHHGEYNWTYKDIPRLFDQVKEVGLNTLFVLGWPKGGFARMWPDYIADPRQGGEEELKKAIDYVHSKGGKLIMFLSYFLIDRNSDFYKNEDGKECLIKDIWGYEYPFRETYCGEGTYRKLPNQPMPMLGACPGSDAWQEKMKKSADYCLNLGCDGVLYDLGGLAPFFCFAEGHDHEKPNFSHASKAKRFAELRETVKRHGDERIILQEHCVDIFAQSMDIVQPSGFGNIRKNVKAYEFMRYTFPEIVMTNREMGQDDSNYLDNVNCTFVYGVAFDMTIYRCCGDLHDVPKYAEYMSRIIALRKQYAKYFFGGRFVDTDGIAASSESFLYKGYLAKDGSLGVAVWNWSKGDDVVTYTNKETGKNVAVSLKKDEVTFVELS